MRFEGEDDKEDAGCENTGMDRAGARRISSGPEQDLIRLAAVYGICSTAARRRELVKSSGFVWCSGCQTLMHRVTYATCDIMWRREQKVQQA